MLSFHCMLAEAKVAVENGSWKFPQTGSFYAPVCRGSFAMLRTWFDPCVFLLFGVG